MQIANKNITTAMIVGNSSQPLVTLSLSCPNDIACLLSKTGWCDLIDIETKQTENLRLNRLSLAMCDSLPTFDNTCTDKIKIKAKSCCKFNGAD